MKKRKAEVPKGTIVLYAQYAHWQKVRAGLVNELVGKDNKDEVSNSAKFFVLESGIIQVDGNGWRFPVSAIVQGPNGWKPGDKQPNTNKMIIRAKAPKAEAPKKPELGHDADTDAGGDWGAMVVKVMTAISQPAGQKMRVTIREVSNGVTREMVVEPMEPVMEQ